MICYLPTSAEVQTRASLGIASLSISSLLVFSSTAKFETPVTLPPGRARVSTKPEPTGSAAVAITMGMVVVAFFASNGVGPPEVTIRSTFRRTRSAASSGRRSDFCSANRYSMVMFFPSIQPSLLSSCRNASKRTALPEAVLLARNPMRKIFPGCCASAMPAKTSTAAATKIDDAAAFFIAHLALRFASALRVARSLDHPIRSRQHVRRNRQADLFGRFEINDQLELLRLLHREIGGLGAFQNLVNIR